MPPVSSCCGQHQGTRGYQQVPGASELRPQGLGCHAQQAQQAQQAERAQQAQQAQRAQQAEQAHQAQQALQAQQAHSSCTAGAQQA